MPDRRFNVIAHRGVTTAAPGNTLAAFRAAQDIDADGVELDVRLTLDGIPIVHHDWYLDETATSPVSVYTRTTEQLRGEYVRDPSTHLAGTHPIPTLVEVLEEFSGRLRLEIELKSPEPELPSAVAAALAPFRPAWQDIEITSSSTSLLAAMRSLCPDLSIALLFGTAPSYMRPDLIGYSVVQLARLARANVVHLQRDQLLDEVVNQIRAAGLGVHGYPIDTESDVRLALHYGLADVVTDDAATVVRLRDALGGAGVVPLETKT